MCLHTILNFELTTPSQPRHKRNKRTKEKSVATGNIDIGEDDILFFYGATKNIFLKCFLCSTPLEETGKQRNNFNQYTSKVPTHILSEILAKSFFGSL